MCKEECKSEEMKYRLAEAVKVCMKTTSVEKITVKEIVDACGTTRQTFYRHFQDKYDLVNWYFDKILLESFEHMGEGETIYEGLVKKSGKPLSEDLKFLLEMYCQGSIYMTVQWVFGRVKRTPEELAADLVKAMPEELAGVFERLNLL